MIGPRKVTRIGWTQRPGTGDYSGPNANEPSKEKIVVDPDKGLVEVIQDDGSTGPYSATTESKQLNYPKILGSTGGADEAIQQPLPIIIGAGNGSTASNPILPKFKDSNGAAHGWGTTASNLYSFDARFPNGIGISVSEPLINAPYYQEPQVARSPFETASGVEEEQAASDGKIWDCYARLDRDKTNPIDGHFRYPDQPEDGGTGSNNGRPLKGTYTPPSSGPVTQSTINMTTTGTYLNYKTVLLQRLANPLLKYDSVTNPYLTVDWMPIDLTVFNGQDQLPNNDTSDNSDPDDKASDRDPDVSQNQSKVAVYFGSRQRGALDQYEYPTSGSLLKNTASNIWAQVSELPPKTTINPDTTRYFSYDLKYYAQPNSSDPTALAQLRL